MKPLELRSILERPLVIAPMAGGPSTPALVVAAGHAGALGFLAAGYKSVAAVTAEIAAVRSASTTPFGVNLFVPGRPTDDPEGLDRYVASLQPEAEALGCVLGDPSWDDDGWGDKLEAVLADPPPVVSFTFGSPTAEVVAALHDAGAAVLVTVTCPDEARIATAAGADGLCVQGPEAGAHRGTFTNDDAPGRGRDLLDLVTEVAKVTDLPQIAAGGVVHRRQVEALLGTGAVAAQCGTAFLRCPESGAAPAHKAALADPRFRSTTVTRAFSGRPARGLVNPYIDRHPVAPAAYPEVNNVTRPLRAAAVAAGDVERMSLWAGQGFASATTRAAAEIVDMLCP